MALVAAGGLDYKETAVVEDIIQFIWDRRAGRQIAEELVTMGLVVGLVLQVG